MKSRIYNILIVILSLLAVALVASAIVICVRSDDTYSPKITAPTCTEYGYTTYYTSDGEVDYIGDYVEALGHDYTLTGFDWSDDYLTVYGIFECSRCGEEIQETAVLNSEIVTEPTQEAAGEIKYTAKVTYGGQEYVDTKTAEIPATSEDTDYVAVTVEATCTEQGYTTYTSADGKYSYVTYTDALGHDYEYLQTYKATCTSSGYDVYVCNRCGETYYTNYVDASGHTFDDDGVCTVCGVSNYVQLTDSDVQNGFSTPFYAKTQYYVFGYVVNTVNSYYWTFGLSNDTGDETTYGVAAIWINGEYVTKLCGFDDDYGYTYLTSYTTDFTLQKGDFIEIYLVNYGTDGGQNLILTFSRSMEYSGTAEDFGDKDFDETTDTTVYYEINCEIATSSSLPDYTCTYTLSDTTGYECQVVTLIINLTGDGVEITDITVVDETTSEEVTVYEIIENYSYKFIMPAGDVSITIYLGETSG